METGGEGMAQGLVNHNEQVADTTRFSLCGD